VKTWLLVAAERREFDGIRKHLAGTEAIQGLGVQFACSGMRGADRWVMVANGPGRELASKASSDAVLRQLGRDNVMGMMSTGYCGALDPELRVGDIVVSDDSELTAGRKFTRGRMTTQDRVAVTAADKRALREQTGAIAVDMEAEAVQHRAKELGVRYACVRVVSDAAEEDMPLDFNRYRTADGNFSRGRIALAAMARPFSVMPALLEFDRRSKQASLALGDFLADCKF
jgi:adenosylhomocysteine nucleosidase